ncbi:MAG: permease-like cell division protein FtsX [Clostridiales bacterium]|nr:permease-like cell division protein FtsX [Clostridiales bacterium]
MKLSTWAYYFREAWQGMRSGGLLSLASSLAIVISLAALAAVMILAFNLQHMTRVVENQLQLVAYLVDDFDRVWQDELMRKVRAIPHVKNARFVTREEGLQRLQEQLGSDSVLLEAAAESGNPLPDAVEVEVDDPRYMGQVAAALGRIQSVEEVAYRRDIVQRLTALTDGIRTVGLALVVLLAAASLLTVANTVRLTIYARRREIAIMKLVGATNGFIRWPFLLEGILFGLLGAGIAVGTAWLGYSWLAARIAEGLPFVPLLPPDRVLFQVAQALFLGGVLLGAGGSLVSLRRFLRV